MLTIVVSGVNMVEGGILSILRDVLKSLSRLKKEIEFSVIVLVHDIHLVADVSEGFKVLAFKDVKSSWIKRLRFEYVTSKKISDKYQPDLWISLHDMTPYVSCACQVVYCHNPSPFYKIELSKILYDRTFTLFTLFYKYLYQINIHKNSYVIVQQNWMRVAFKKFYRVNSIVAYPKLSNETSANNRQDVTLPFNPPSGYSVFFYPSFPRVFKNMECVCKAAELLSSRPGNFTLIITLNGSENKYAAKIYQKYQHVKQIKFVGIQSRDIIERYYQRADCLVFPSKLETWGLPVSEFMTYDKPILIADAPYAHETIGNYRKAKFFKADDPQQLAIEMEKVINNHFIPDDNFTLKPAEPFFDNWDHLLKFLLNKSIVR